MVANDADETTVIGVASGLDLLATRQTIIVSRWILAALCGKPCSKACGKNLHHIYSHSIAVTLAKLSVGLRAILASSRPSFTTIVCRQCRRVAEVRLRNSTVYSLGIAAILFAVNAFADGYKVSHLADGAPDLQGNWTNASATPMDRPREFGMRRGLTEAEAAVIQKRELDRVAADAAPADPDAKAVAGSLPPVGNYNLFWTERGMSATQIDGEYRTSIIIDPPNGRTPALTKEAMQRRSAMRVKTMGSADGPEQRSLGERCLLSFGSSAGPPMLPSMYNSNYTIVQSPGFVVIETEMVHDARIIRIGDQHAPESVRKWMGDSIGRWEGDTLVIETKYFRHDQSYRGSSENMVVTERLTRVGKDQINYRFTIDDPGTFTSSFTGELAFTSYAENLYEYACHEGNYALSGIMLGAREDEKAKEAKQK